MVRVSGSRLPKATIIAGSRRRRWLAFQRPHVRALGDLGDPDGVYKDEVRLSLRVPGDRLRSVSEMVRVPRPTICS